MRSHLPHLLLAAMVTTFTAVSHSARPSLCAPSEEVIFSCTLKRSAKQLVLCAAKTQKGNLKNAYVAYRFGRPGNIDFEFPSAQQNSAKQFRFFHYFRPGLASTEVSFENSGYVYAIFDNTETNLNDGRSESTAGVRVSGPKGKGETTLECVQRTVITSWALIEGVISCDAESEANMCIGENQ